MELQAFQSRTLEPSVHATTPQAAAVAHSGGPSETASPSRRGVSLRLEKTRDSIDNPHLVKVDVVRQNVFVSYAHDDREWLELFDKKLRPAIGDKLRVWSDRDIAPGNHWAREIDRELSCATAARCSCRTTS